MVLRSEVESVQQLEIGSGATKSPHDRAVGAGDFVNGVGIASGNEIITVSTLVQGIDVTDSTLVKYQRFEIVREERVQDLQKSQ
jgi:hypothetical protein